MLETLLVWHEINNSLTAVNLTLEFLHKHGAIIPKKELQQELNFSLQSLEHVRNVINLASRVDPVTALRRKKFQLLELIQTVVAVITKKWPNAQVEIIENVPNSELIGDETAMTQVLMNLITNAVESYENKVLAGKLPVKITLKKSVQLGILLAIQDWGVGIPAHAQCQIFRRFFTLKDGQGGTGIGLSLSKEIIENQFGGKISFVSQVGEGSTFTVEIPVTTT